MENIRQNPEIKIEESTPYEKKISTKILSIASAISITALSIFSTLKYYPIYPTATLTILGLGMALRCIGESIKEESQKPEKIHLLEKEVKERKANVQGLAFTALGVACMVNEIRFPGFIAIFIGGIVISEMGFHLANMNIEPIKSKAN